MKKTILFLMLILTAMTMYSAVSAVGSRYYYQYRVLGDGTAEITEYTGDVKSFTVPSVVDGIRVTSIGDSAFSKCGGMTSVTIPEGITSIGNMAFEGCSTLTSVTFPESLRSIGNYAFKDCSSLNSVNLPENIAVGIGAFDSSIDLHFGDQAEEVPEPSDDSEEEEPDDEGITPEAVTDPDVSDDTIAFGRYEQDNNKANGPEPIEWKIVAEAAGSAYNGKIVLLVSTKVLDAMPFNSGGTNSWEDSSLRKWLAKDFYEGAFSVPEQRVIRKVSHKADPADKKPVTDTVFVLSRDEIRHLLPEQTDRQFDAAPFAVSKKVYRGANGKACWWTRTYYSKGVVYNIWSDGNMDHGSKVTDWDGGVLPAVWIDLDEWERLQ